MTETRVTFWEKLEHIIDLIIPVTLVLMIGLIIVEFAYTDLVTRYELGVEIIDGIILLIFIIDLSFKYHHSKSIPQFLKSYWLEILAVIPFFLVFRLLDGLGLLTFATAEVAVKEGQSIAHVGAVAEKEAVVVGKAIVAGEKEVAAALRSATTVEKEVAVALRSASTVEKEVAAAANLTRAQRLTRFLRPIFDSKSLVHVTRFFEHPKHRRKV